MRLCGATHTHTFSLTHPPARLVQGDITVGVKFEDQVVSSQTVRELTVEVLSAAGLANADKKGMSDPYCLVYWNEKRVGQTAVVTDNQVCACVCVCVCVCV